MWILQILPDWIFHVILLLGLGGLGASFLLKFFPQAEPYKLLIQVVASIMIVLGVYMEGAISNQMYWELKVSDAEKKVLEAEAKAATANATIEYVYVDKIKYVAINDAKVKNDIKQNANKIDAACIVLPEVTSILNSAARVPAGDKK